MFGIGGERDLPERELPHLAGWRTPCRCGSATGPRPNVNSTSMASCSAPVYRLSDQVFDVAQRVGPQVAADKWGAATELAPATRRFLVELADTAAQRWQEKDQGIWEVRGEPRTPCIRS